MRPLGQTYKIPYGYKNYFHFTNTQKPICKLQQWNDLYTDMHLLLYSYCGILCCSLVQNFKQALTFLRNPFCPRQRDKVFLRKFTSTFPTHCYNREDLNINLRCCEGHGSYTLRRVRFMGTKPEKRLQFQQNNHLVCYKLWSRSLTVAWEMIYKGI
jgi:hypothetical protein